MIKNINLIVLIVCMINGLYAQVSVERNFNLELVEKDSITSLKIETALNGFLTEAQERNFSEKYVDSAHLNQYEFFFHKLAGIGGSENFNNPLVLKSYPVGNGSYRLTIGFTGERDGNPFIYQMTELKAVLYNNQFRFYCPFEDNTEYFNSKTLDHVTFYYSTSFNETKAKEFVAFTKELSKLTKTPISQLKYYSFNSLDELLKSYGFLYSARQCNFLHYDLGFTDNKGHTYITGMNDENFVFGFIGDYLYYNLPNRDDMYNPFVYGISAYYGDYSYDDMNTLKSQFRQEIEKKPSINFLDEFKKGRKSSVHRHFSHYVMSAFLFEEALNKKGFDMALSLAYTGSKGERFFQRLQEVLNVNEANFHETILRLIEDPKMKNTGAFNVFPDTIPFRITKDNNIVFKGIVNHTDTLDWFFDTGSTDLVMLQSAVKELKYTPLEDIYTFSIGNMTWDSLTIYPFPVGPKETVGHFGWNLFKDKIVELDYEKRIMIIHLGLPPNLKDYTKLKMEYMNTLFCINGSIKIGEKAFTNRYLFDSGFQRAVVLDKDLNEQSNFPDTLHLIKESKLRNSRGTEFINRVVEVDKICFGEYCVNQVPAHLFAAPNPARFETHILGADFLKRFNTVIDFQDAFVYMKPNTLMGLPFNDAS